MCVRVDKTWKATNVLFEACFVFTYFMCSLYLETFMNLQIEDNIVT